MKKLAFVFAAIVAVSFASCGNKTEQGAATDSDSIAADTIDTVAADTDSVAADTVATPVAE